MEPKKRTLVLHNIEPHVADVAVVLAKELPLETLRKVHSGAAVLLEYVRSLLFGEDVDEASGEMQHAIFDRRKGVRTLGIEATFELKRLQEESIRRKRVERQANGGRKKIVISAPQGCHAPEGSHKR